MDHQLVIDSDDAYALATELAQLTGTNVCDAVTLALRETVERQRDIAGRITDVRRMARELKSHLREPVSSEDHNKLYDANGMPA